MVIINYKQTTIMNSITKEITSNNFNQKEIWEQDDIMNRLMETATVEDQSKYFVILVNSCLWQKWETEVLMRVREGMKHGSVHISTKIMNRFKEGWAELRELLIAMKGPYESLTGGHHISKFFTDMAKMYTYLHNGNMDRYAYYANKVLTKLNDVLTNSMDNDFALFGFCCVNGWVLNTDECTLQLANMMQNVQLHRDVFMTLRNGSVSREDADFFIRETDV